MTDYWSLVWASLLVGIGLLLVFWKQWNTDEKVKECSETPCNEQPANIYEGSATEPSIPCPSTMVPHTIGASPPDTDNASADRQSAVKCDGTNQYTMYQAFGLKIDKVTQTSITVNWNIAPPESHQTSDCFCILKYKEAFDTNPDNDRFTKIMGPVCVHTIHDLKPNTAYRVWVSAGNEQGDLSEFCKPIDIYTIKQNDSDNSLAKYIINDGFARKIQDGNPSIYEVPLCPGPNLTHSYHTYKFGNPGLVNRKHIVIMVVGATGAGKSTLINGMVNYILKVQWDDPYRFKIISEKVENQSGGQSESQTQLITAYTIYHQHGLNIDSTVTIIDTPGFGDTRGIQRDNVIIDQIREFFTSSSEHHIDHIDAIGFVSQASQARLTPTQNYVFESILAIFGCDIEQNIILLITFADGQKPPVIDAIKAADIPCTNNIFKFNNSALFANNVQSPEGLSLYHPNVEGQEQYSCFDKMFWQMGTQSMKKFFDALKHLDQQSLILTREVLKERKRLELTIEGLQPQIHMGCCKLEQLQQEQRILEQHETDIEANKEYKYTVTVPKTRQIMIKHGEYITNCANCHFTCHFPCKLANDNDKAGCAAMKNGKCEVCPDKCKWNDHFNQGYRFEIYEETEDRTYSELEERYRDATGKKLTVEQVIEKLEEEFVNVQQCVYLLITYSHKSLKRLDEIALRPNPLSTVAYVDILIEAEKMKAEPGWKNRIRALEGVRKSADILGKIRSGYNPFENYKEQFLKNKKKKGKRWIRKAWDKIFE